MNIILLKNFNNYFNRIIKKYDHIDDYLENCDDYEFTEVVNFMSNDGISTSQVFNMKKDFVPDYCLLITPSNAGGFVIASRWFVFEWTKISGKQYRAELHNDVLADNLDNIVDAPIFIEKGQLREINPLLFNSESMTYNQIKKEEVLLRDKSRIGWIVGYYAQEINEDKNFKSTYDYIEGSEPIIDYESISKDIKINFPNAFVDLPTKSKPKNVGAKLWAKNNNSTQTLLDYNVADETIATLRTQNVFDTLKLYLLRYDEDKKQRFESDMFSYFESQMFIYDTVFEQATGIDVHAGPTIREIRNLQNKVVRYENKLYRLSIGNPRTRTRTHAVKYGTLDAEDIASGLLQNSYSKNYYEPSFVGESKDKTCSEIYIEYEEYVIYAKPLETVKKQVSTTFTATRNHLNDAPYDMFCIPYDKFENETRYFTNDSYTKSKIENYLSLVIAKGIASQSGGLGSTTTLVYDMQLLPYCPIPEVKDTLTENDDGSMTFNLKALEGFKEGQDYNLVFDTTQGSVGQPVSIVFWATKSSGTFNIPFKRKVSEDPVERKVQNETEFVRLCSPNYSGLFEFSPAKNNGIEYFNVDYTYKPYNPYIHINPDFKGLYGYDFNDSRGLIVGGDFSIGAVTDRFAQYELNNKNYQQMFDREIVNMDVNNSLTLTKQSIGGLMGIGGGATAGAIAGAKGGPAGMIAGGLTGGLSAALGMAVDIGVNQAGYRESKDYKMDMFGYQLGNIKALPSSLSKTTAYTFNNKVYPFVEFYDCTDIEKQALRDKIKYDGMTIMAISTIRHFMSNTSEPSFIKGKIIRLENVSDDSHIASVIFDELDKGVYI